MLLFVYIVLAILFGGLYINILANKTVKEKKQRKTQVILANLALVVYIFGYITPIPEYTGIIVAYLLLVIAYVQNVREKKNHFNKMIVIAVMVVAELINTNSVIFASVDNYEYEHAKSILVEDYGMDDFLLSQFEYSDIIEIAKQVENDPNCLTVSKSTNVIDNIESIENAVNLSEEELVKLCGLKYEEAHRIKKEIEIQRKLSDEQLKEKYELNDTEIKIFRKALMEQGDYVPYKSNEREVTLSSTISSSYLDYYHIILNQSTANEVKYNVALSFNWLKPCWDSSYNDTIAVAWGGGLLYDSSSVSKKVSYKNAWGAFYSNWEFIGSIIGSKSPSADVTIDAGVAYSFPQKYSNSITNISRIKEGLIQFKIGNSDKQGKTTQIVSKYCHAIMTTSSASISIKGPSISVSSAYETTDDDENCTNITY